MARRSYLFVPADRPDRYEKALAAGAGAVIVDLEDAVAPDAKDAARETLIRWLSRAPAQVLVRVNGGETEWFADDRGVRHASVAGTCCRRPSDAPISRTRRRSRRDGACTR
jgi:citrate lyase subunit beta/citryl-CoA lyase